MVSASRGLKPNATRVELVQVVDRAADTYVVGIGSSCRRDPGGVELRVGDLAQARCSPRQVVPQGRQVGSAGEPPGHAHQRHRRVVVGLRHDASRSTGLRMGV